MAAPQQDLFLQDTTTDPKKDTTDQPSKDTSSFALAMVSGQDYQIYQDTTTLPKRDTTDKPAKDSVPTTDSTTASVAVVTPANSALPVTALPAAALVNKNESLT